MARAQGLRAWLIQRLSAVYIFLYFIFLMLNLIARPPHGYVEWQGFMTAPAMGVATFLLFMMLLLHAWVGMRDVVMDYVHSFKLRMIVLILIGLGLTAMGTWVLLVLTRAV